MDAFWQYQLEVLNLLRDFINSEKIRIDLVYDKINDIEFLYLKNSVISELWIRDFLPHIINGNLEYLITGLFKKIPNLSNEEYNRLLANGVVLICIGKDNYAAYLSFPPKRTPTDSLCDPSNLFGARDGFNEVIADNRILIRKRIKSSNLLFEELFLGNMTSTEINIAYLKKNEKLATKIKNILLKNTDRNITSINDLNILITKQTLVPQFMYTSNPETCVNALLKDRIIILLDNSPVALILPSSLLEFTENSNETNNFSFVTLFNRLIILVFLFITIFLLGLFILLTSHHPEALSTLFIANFQLSERGTTFSLFIEIIIVLILFEFYRQLAMRSPLSFVQNIIIIFGGLFIGQNAIEAGLIGTTAIIITSLSYVSSFAVTNNTYLINSFAIFRFFIMSMSYALGMIGFLVSSILVISYLANIKVFDRYYLEPIIPFNFTKLKAWFIPRKD